MGHSVDMLVYYCIMGLVLTFVSLPYLTALGQKCGNTYVQCIPAWDQSVKNFYGSAYTAGTSEFQFGQLILIGGLIFFWVVIPGIVEAIRYLRGAM